jgi:hypothetical protein
MPLNNLAVTLADGWSDARRPLPREAVDPGHGGRMRRKCWTELAASVDIRPDGYLYGVIVTQLDTQPVLQSHAFEVCRPSSSDDRPQLGG